MEKTCKTHNKPLRSGINGSWYCSTKDDSSPTGWCQTREFDNQPKNAPISEPNGKEQFGLLKEVIKLQEGLKIVNEKIDGLIERWDGFMQTGKIEFKKTITDADIPVIEPKENLPF